MRTTTTFLSVSAAVHSRPVGAVAQVHQGVDGRGVGGSDHLGRRLGGGVDARRHRSGDGLGVGRVAAVGTHEGVLTDRRGVEELLGVRAAHGAGHGVDGHVLQAQAAEDALIGVTVALVGGVQPGVVDVEGVGVLHDELTPADQARARAGLVTVLGLDLVQGGGQVLVGGEHVLGQEGEHLLVGGGQQVVPALAVLQGEECGAVLVPALGRFVGLSRQEGREMDLLTAHAVHLLTHDRLDLAHDGQAQRQPGVDAWGGAADVGGTHEQLVAGDLGIGGVLTQGTDEGGRESLKHGAILRGPRTWLSPAAWQILCHVLSAGSGQVRGDEPQGTG